MTEGSVSTMCLDMRGRPRNPLDAASILLPIQNLSLPHEGHMRQMERPLRTQVINFADPEPDGGPR